MSPDEAPRAAWMVAIAGGLIFIASLAYFGWCWVRGFDTAATSAAMLAPTVVDVLLFSVFAMHHTLFARTGLKRWVTAHVPPVLERSTYVWIASALFIATCALWQPVPGAIWRIEGPLAVVMRVLQAIAAAATLVAARSLDALDLAGLRQVMTAGHPQAPPRALDDHGLYGLVRHPIYTAWLAIVWLPPVMNGSRLVFAIVSSLYLCLAVPFEERDLRRVFGDAYAQYQRRVRWRMVPFLY
jgi:methanethiol S-methyltransferase